MKIRKMFLIVSLLALLGCNTFLLPQNQNDELLFSSISAHDGLVSSSISPEYSDISFSTNSSEPNISVFGYNQLTVEEFNDGALWTQGCANIENFFVSFSPSNDDHSDFAEYVIRNIDTKEVVFRGIHNLGHCASLDYNQETDELLVANGTYTEGVAPSIFIIENAKSTLRNQEDILFENPNVISVSLKGLLGEGVVSCFGEEKDIIYALLNEDANEFMLHDGKFLYKILLGRGSDNLLEKSSRESLGEFLGGKSHEEFNGTIEILKKYSANYYFELQGLKYNNNTLIASCDTTVDGVLAAYLITIIRNDTEGSFTIGQSYWIPCFSEEGNYLKSESQDIVFVNDYGYVVLFFYTIDSSITYKFKIIEQ